MNAGHECTSALGARDDTQPPRPPEPREDVAAHRVVHRQIAQHLILGDDAGACRNASGQTCLRPVDGPFPVLRGRRAPSRPAAASAARPAWTTSSVSEAYTVPARRRRAAGRPAPTPPAPPAEARRRADPRAGKPAARRTRRPRGRGRRRPCPSLTAARRAGRCGPGRPDRGARPYGRQRAAGSSAAGLPRGAHKAPQPGRQRCEPPPERCAAARELSRSTIGDSTGIPLNRGFSRAKHNGRHRHGAPPATSNTRSRVGVIACELRSRVPAVGDHRGEPTRSVTRHRAPASRAVQTLG